MYMYMYMFLFVFVLFPIQLLFVLSFGGVSLLFFIHRDKKMMPNFK